MPRTVLVSNIHGDGLRAYGEALRRRRCLHQLETMTWTLMTLSTFMIRQTSFSRFSQSIRSSTVWQEQTISLRISQSLNTQMPHSYCSTPVLIRPFRRLLGTE